MDNYSRERRATAQPDPIGDELRALNGLPDPAERRALREGSGLSQARLARAVGVSRQAISQWETGARMVPRGPLLDKYVEALRRLKAESLAGEGHRFSTAVYYGQQGRRGDIIVEALDRESEICGNCENDPPAGFTCRTCGADGGPR